MAGAGGSDVTAPGGFPALRLGTRKSPMAMAQSQHVASIITARTGREVVLVGMSTLGDVNQAELVQIGGTGVFVSGVRASLLSGDIDIAVHSLKDLPAAQPPEIELAAVPVRDDPRDALAAPDSAKLADLPPGARIGTGSPRRAAQLLLMRQDLCPVPLRGNAGTRLAKVACGDLDGVVLALAGLARIGRLDAVTQVFEPDEMMPAPGQGALAVECLSARTDLVALLAVVDDTPSHAAATAERSLLSGLQAGCSAPVGGYAAGTDELRLRAVVVAADGETALRASAGGPAGDAERLGREVAAELLHRGAGRYTAAGSNRIADGRIE
jgi:hydroxymethylbilane synthase